MNPLDLLLVTLVLLAAALPGWALVRRLVARESESLALGAALGIAGHAVIGVLAPSQLGVRLVAADLLAAAVLFLVPGGRPLRFAWPARELASVGVVAASFLVLVLRHGAPRGWDPSFHVLLIERLVETGELPRTWEPWEPVSVHYTLGLHAVVAHVARAVGLRAHVAFQGSFFFAYVLVAASALHVVRRATRSRVRAAFATLALGLLAVDVRLVYHWGGLPTVFGLGLALGAAHAVVAIPGRRGVVLGGALLGALPYLHHLSALIAWSVAAAIASVLSLRGETRVNGARAWAALLLAALLAAPLAPSVLAAARARDATSIFHYTDEPVRALFSYPKDWGYPLSALALLGLFGARRRRAAALTALCFLVGMHLFLDLAYRFVAQHMTGEAFTALTPTRWFMVASVPLAFFAGEGAAVIAARLGRRKRILSVSIGLVALALPGAAWEFRSQSLDPSLEAVAAWARKQLPEQALVVVRARTHKAERGLLPSRYWWPYFLRGETDETPLPASEPRRDPRVLEKRGILGADESVDVARAVARRRGKRLFWLGPSALPPVRGATRLSVEDSGVALDEVR